MTTTNTVNPAAADAGHHAHPAHLAHHFKTPEQQYMSAKLGMWIFLGTEILMFSGLFCAYAVYRHNHPEVFEFAHEALNKTLGALNTIVLITSSLTMAWGVRCAQMNKKRGLVICLILTLMGAAGFMVIKGFEYHHKYEFGLWVGRANTFSPEYKGKPGDKMFSMTGEGPLAMPEHQTPPLAPVTSQTPRSTDLSILPPDPNAGTGDAAKIRPSFAEPSGIVPQKLGHHRKEVTYQSLTQLDKDRVATFFNIYYLMTGLHGIHVLVGMGLIFWLLLRSIRGDFSSEYFTPVDLVGLYWHLVDLIWIFLFPLLYLIT